MSYEIEKSKQLQQLKRQVMEILEESMAARNCDTWLICYWLEQYRDINTVSQIRRNAENISFESIRRARQKIQAAGLFLPTDETVIKRRKLQAVYEQVMRRDSDGTN